MIGKQNGFFSAAPDMYKDKVHEMAWALFAKVANNGMSTARTALNSLALEAKIDSVDLRDLAQWVASASTNLSKPDGQTFSSRYLP